jgi:hypothetical protein
MSILALNHFESAVTTLSILVFNNAAHLLKILVAIKLFVNIDIKVMALYELVPKLMSIEKLMSLKLFLVQFISTEENECTINNFKQNTK